MEIDEMYEDKELTWNIWRIHYTPPDSILPYEKLAFVFRYNECWEEKFDTGFFNRTEALLIAARLQTAYRGKYAFIVQPNTYQPPYAHVEDQVRKTTILKYIRSKIKPQEEEATARYIEDEDEFVSFEDEEAAREDEIEEINSQRFLGREYEKFDYYENFPEVEDD